MIDLIVPTIPGREESLDRCLRSFERLKGGLNRIVVPESKTCGEGWIEGLARSEAPYVALVADDLECVSDSWAEVCIDTADMDCIPCPRVWAPDGSIESQGGDMNAPGHIIQRHQKDRTGVDFTTVPFLSQKLADEIGMIPTQYACDVWVSYRGRQLGYDTMLRHGYDLVHYQEQVGRGAGMDQNERDRIDTETMFTELTYASHTETLCRTLSEVKPKNVLEIGSGRYSTKEILRCEYVEHLDSLETDPKWAEQVTQLCGDDPRLRVYTAIPKPENWATQEYDLIFIDGPDTERERLENIRSVLSRPHPVTVIHDAEHPPYRQAIEELTNGNVSYFGEGKQTAVVR
jgi:predicted O-methyltransferase YrrM